MDLKLLGPLEIDPRIPGTGMQRSKEKAILVVLALSPGQVVTAETILRKVWDDDSPSAAVKRTMQSYVAHVKSIVTAVGGARLEPELGGYVLRIDRESVDVHRFRQLVRQAEAIAASGDAEHAVSLLQEAEGLWRDQAFAGLSGRWIESMRHSLHEQRRMAVNQRIALELGRGRDAEMVGELTGLNRQFPDDEIRAGFLMQALYRTGRESDALAVYQRDYERRSELGLGTSPRLTALQEQILRRDPVLEVAPAERRTEFRRAPWSTGLPPRPRVFVGREKELALLCDVPATGGPTVRVIDGMGGCGKSALAIEAAFRLRDRYSDPPIFMRFHAYEAGQKPLDVRDALRQLLELSGAMPESAPQATAELSALWQREAGRRRSVIILDDVRDASTVVGVMPTTGASVVIVTSRRRLSELSPSVAVSLEELPQHDAVTLFERIVGSTGTDDPAILAQAVQLCGCLPLAVTLGASRVRDEGSTASEFVAEIEERRAFSSPGSVAFPGLMEMFELSYADLDASHQEFFRRLGVNPCPNFNARTAAVLVGTTIKAAASALRVLHDRHLVEWVTTNRYRLHDLLGEYAAFVAERDDSGWERRRAEHRLLDYFLNTARRADRLLYPYRRRSGVDSVNFPLQSELGSPESSIEWLEAEWRNVVKLANYAVRHEWKQYCVDLSDVLAEFLDGRGYWMEGINLHGVALRACRDLGDPLRLAQIANNLSLFEGRTGNYRDAMTQAEEALEIYRSSVDRRGIAESLDRIGVINRLTGRPSVALSCHQEAVEEFRKIRDDHGAANGLCNAGAAYYDLGRYAKVVDHNQEALVIYRNAEDLHGEAKCLNNIGDALCRQGRYPDAESHLDKALKICQQEGARQHLAIVRLNIGCVAQSKGRYRDAITSYHEALDVCRTVGDLRHMAGALCGIGDSYQAQEYYDQALVHYEQAEKIAKEIDDGGMQETVYLGIAGALSGGGNYSRALDRYSIALRIAKETGGITQKAQVLEGMAETRFRMRDVTAARLLLREALEAYQATGAQEAARVRLRLSVLES
ncbi:MAG TPA: tetratricopeptide repeat protein [Trebonia sp.]